MNIRFVTTSVFCMSLIASAVFPAKAQQDVLLNAIKNNSGVGVQQALLNGVIQSKDGKSHESVLLKAIMTGTTDEIKQAVQPILDQGKNDMSPITWAVLLQKPEAVKVLLDCGAKCDVNIATLAVKMKDVRTALVIVRSGMNISSIMDDYIKMAISSKIQREQGPLALELIQEVINHGYDVNNVWMVHAREHSCFNENTVRLLIKNGANPNYVFKLCPSGSSSEDKSVLMIAIENSQKQLVEILLNAGADVNQKVTRPDGNYSPLAWAIERNVPFGTSLVPLLLEHSATL